MFHTLLLAFTQDTAALEQLIVEDKSHGKMPLIVFGTAGEWGVNEPCVFLNVLVSDLHKSCYWCCQCICGGDHPL